MIEIISIIIKAIFIALFLQVMIEAILGILYIGATQRELDANGRAAKIIKIVSICVTVLFFLRHGCELAQPFF